MELLLTYITNCYKLYLLKMINFAHSHNYILCEKLRQCEGSIPVIIISKLVASIIDVFKKAGIRTSVFVNADEEMVLYAAKAGADRVELYTEPYASGYKRKEEAVKPFIGAAMKARELGLGLNAGHDLSLENLKYFHESIPWIDEVSIGHALICDALYMGLQKTVQAYLKCLD